MGLGVLASGNGSNLQAIIDACAGGRLAAKLRVVISDNPQAFALQRAQGSGIPAYSLNAGDYPDRASFDAATVEILRQHGVELVALAGYMRIISPLFVHAFPQRIVNVHPSLLPSFPGLDAIGQALRYGVKVTGCTVHLVDEGVDTGPPLVQRGVQIAPEDTHASLAEKIHQEEHQAMIEALQIVIKRISREDERP